MPGSFEIFAEVGIGLAGFSGLIMALRKDPGPLNEVQKFRMSLLFLLAFGATFLSFLPQIYMHMAVSEDGVGEIAASSMLAYSAVLMWWWFRRSRHFAKLVPEIFNWYVFTAMSVGHISVIVLQLCVVFDLLSDRASGIYMFGLTWYLVHAAQQFARMLFIHPRS